MTYGKAPFSPDRQAYMFNNAISHLTPLARSETSEAHRGNRYLQPDAEGRFIRDVAPEQNEAIDRVVSMSCEVVRNLAIDPVPGTLPEIDIDAIEAAAVDHVDRDVLHFLTLSLLRASDPSPDAMPEGYPTEPTENALRLVSFIWLRDGPDIKQRLADQTPSMEI